MTRKRHRESRDLQSREKVNAVVARMDQLDDERRTELEWRGGEAVVREVDRVDGTELARFTLLPDAAGHYLLDMGLTLSEVD